MEQPKMYQTPNWYDNEIKKLAQKYFKFYRIGHEAKDFNAEKGKIYRKLKTGIDQPSKNWFSRICCIYISFDLRSFHSTVD